MKYFFLALATVLAICVGCQIDGQQLVDTGDYVAPPAAMLQRPGPMVDGPGPGVIGMYAPPERAFATRTSQVRFVGPLGMQVGWKVGEIYAENQLTTPGRYNFHQGATYRLKFTNVPGREGVTLYPSLQVYPAHPTTDAYLAHNSVPLELTDEDLDQIESNNFVTKVIYLPDPKFQEFAIAGVETLVSTRLDPGVDPVSEADRRGSIMLVLRVGNMDLEMPAQPSGPAGGGSPAQQVSYRMFDGEEGQFVPPTPDFGAGPGEAGVPAATMVYGGGMPGMPSFNALTGVPGAPVWGSTTSSTPIGLPGPPHLPLGHPVSLQSHTVRNQTKVDMPQPVDHFLMDVSHSPGIRMPKPVRHVEYSESHPILQPGAASYPAWSLPDGGR